MSSIHDDLWGRDALASAEVRAQHDDAVRASVIARLAAGETTLDALKQRAREANTKANELRGDVERARVAADTARRARELDKFTYWANVRAADLAVTLAERALAEHERAQRVYWARVRVAQAWHEEHEEHEEHA